MSTSSAQRPKIAVIGDTYVDIQTNIPRLPEWGTDTTVDSIQLLVGGSATNTARHLNALGFDVRLFSAIGKDEFGAFLRRKLSEEDMKLDPTVVSLDCATCACIVLSGKTDRSFVSCNTAAGRFTVDMIDRDELQGVDHVHLGGYFNCTALHTDELIELFEFIHSGGATISMDCQFDASGRWTGENGNLAKVLPHVDYLLTSDVEAQGITSKSSNLDALLDLHKQSPKSTVAVKCGEDGAIFLPSKEISRNDDSPNPVLEKLPQASTHFSQPATKVNVVDTTGAGDAFNAGFIYSIFGGDEAALNTRETPQPASESGQVSGVSEGRLKEAVRLGCAAGSWSVTQNGACVNPLTVEELVGFINRH